MSNKVIQIKDGEDNAFPTNLVYQKEFPIGTATNYYDEGTLDITVQGKTPISVGWRTNQVGVYMWRLYIIGNTLYYGRRSAFDDLSQNTAVFYVTYI